VAKLSGALRGSLGAWGITPNDAPGDNLLLNQAANSLAVRWNFGSTVRFVYPANRCRKALSMASGDTTSQPGAANNFVSPQTALSFPVASGAITATWRIAAQLYAPLGKTAWVPVGMACAIGICFYLVSDKPRGSFRDRLPSILAAFFNTVTLAAAALGLSHAIGSEPGAPGGRS